MNYLTTTLQIIIINHIQIYHIFLQEYRQPYEIDEGWSLQNRCSLLSTLSRSLYQEQQSPYSDNYLEPHRQLYKPGRRSFQSRRRLGGKSTNYSFWSYNHKTVPKRSQCLFFFLSTCCTCQVSSVCQTKTSIQSFPQDAFKKKEVMSTSLLIVPLSSGFGVNFSSVEIKPCNSAEHKHNLKTFANATD